MHARVQAGYATLAVMATSLLGVQAAFPPSPSNETKLVANDGGRGDMFGSSVSIDGETAIVGSSEDDERGVDAGSAYIFVLEGGTWVEQAKLIPESLAAGDRFGSSVSISGDTALVGAYGDGENGWNAGAAYTFVRSGNAWSEHSKLLPSDGAAADHFAISVSLSGDGALIGSYLDDDNGPDSGSAYVFTLRDGVWIEQAKLVATDGIDFDRFGESVSIDGEAALVGASDNDDNGAGSGSAYIFTSSGGVWSEQTKLLPSDGEQEHAFGVSVSLAGDRALIGAIGDDDKGFDAGAAYVFVNSGGVWTEEAKLVASDGTPFDGFGISVSLSGGTSLVGAFSAAGVQSTSGAAYVHVRTGTFWSEFAKLQASDGESVDFYGRSVANSDDLALVGALRDDHDKGIDAGSAYVYAPDSLKLSLSGTCPGSVLVTLSNAPPHSEVAVIAAATNNGYTKGGQICSGTALEVGEPFQLPPTFIRVDGSGAGTGSMTLQSDRCWLEALALDNCELSGAVQVQ